MIRSSVDSVLLLWCVSGHAQSVRSDGGTQQGESPISAAQGDLLSNHNDRPGDSPQLGRAPHRNNAVDEANAPTDWNVWTGDNIRWSVQFGAFTHGSPVIANGEVYVGTNNGGGYIKRLPKTVNFGVVLCFRESDGKFLWQHSAGNLSRNR